MQQPVRMGILGCASVAEYALLAPAQEKTGITVTAIGSRDLARAKAYAQLHNIPNHYTYENLLNDPNIEAVYIALPNSMHCEWSIRAMEAGKAVLCEKPAANNAREAQRISDTVNRTGQIFVEAFHWPYHPLAQRIKELTASGILGSITSIDIRFMIPEGLVGGDDIRFQYKLGGGCTMDAGCYCVSFMRYLLGEPERIISAEPTLYKDNIDTGMLAKLEFPQGNTGRFECSYTYNSESFDVAATIIGTQGQLKVTNPFMPHMGSNLTLTVDGKISHEQTTTVSSYHFQAKEFSRIIRERVIIPTPIANSIANMHVIDDIYRCAGLPVRGAWHLTSS